MEITPLYAVLTAMLVLPSFMLQDVLGSLMAVLAFAAVLYAPGYLVGQASDVFGFRRLSFAGQSVWAVNLSVCVAPIAAHLLGRALGLEGVCGAFLGCAVLAAVLFWMRRRTFSWSKRDLWLMVALAAGWTATVLVLLIDFQVGHRLFFSVVMADQSYRISFTDAVLRTGIPPANPLYFAGAPAPMRYFYFWYVLCAAAAKLAHVSARQAFLASSVWAGFALLTTTWSFGRLFMGWARRTQWIALGLLLVTGADLLPAIGQALLQPALNGDTEWWSVDPIDAWPDSLLWVPHHVASVLCCLLAFLLIWSGRRSQSRWPWRTLLIAGAAFASAFGLSVYVAFGFVLLLLLWLVRLFFQREPDRFVVLRHVLAAGLCSGVLALPFLLELVRDSAGSSPGAVSGSQQATSPHLFSVSVRRMIDSGLLTGLPVFDHLTRSHPLLLDQSLRLLLLLPGLAMELGVYGAVLVFLVLARRGGEERPKEDARRTALFFAVAGLVLTMFLSSAVITNNDFGYRAVMLPQFFLLLLTADVLGSWSVGSEHTMLLRPTAARRRWVYGLLVTGVLGSVYWAVLLRAWLPIEVARPENGFSRLPEDEFQIREAFERLGKQAPSGAVLQFRPIDALPDRHGEVMTPNEYYQRMLVMDAGRQWLNAEEKCAVHFGGDQRRCAAIQEATRELYAMPAPTVAFAADFCRRFGVQYLVLSAWDPQWKDGENWPAKLPLVVEEPRFRILQCR